MSDDPPRPYPVGYGKPPAHSRFKSGGKGGPGRPKGSKNFSTIWKEEMGETYPVQENGKIRRYSALRLAIRRLKNSALSGNLPATLRLIETHQRIERDDQQRQDAQVVPDLSAEDMDIVAQFMAEQQRQKAAAAKANRAQVRQKGATRLGKRQTRGAGQ